MTGVFGFRILDRFCLLHDGRELQVRGQKQKALLAWFCLSGQPALSRDRLADLLWSDSGSDKARGSLRNTLHVLARDAGTTQVGFDFGIGAAVEEARHA